MLRLSLISLILAFSASANAEGFDYDFLSAGYGDGDFGLPGGGNLDGDGFTVGASYAITDSYYVIADYQSASLDQDTDATIWAAGFGYHRGMSDKVDLVAKLSYKNVEYDLPLAASLDDSGLGLSVGFRFAQSDKLELNAGINYINYDVFDDDTGFELGALYDVNDKYSVGLSGEWSDIRSMYTLTGRMYFGK